MDFWQNAGEEKILNSEKSLLQNTALMCYIGSLIGLQYVRDVVFNHAVASAIDFI